MLWRVAPEKQFVQSDLEHLSELDDLDAEKIVLRPENNLDVRPSLVRRRCSDFCRHEFQEQVWIFVLVTVTEV